MREVRERLSPVLLSVVAYWLIQIITVVQHCLSGRGFSCLGFCFVLFCLASLTSSFQKSQHEGEDEGTQGT